MIQYYTQTYLNGGTMQHQKNYISKQLEYVTKDHVQYYLNLKWLYS